MSREVETTMDLEIGDDVITCEVTANVYYGSGAVDDPSDIDDVKIVDDKGKDITDWLAVHDQRTYAWVVDQLWEKFGTPAGPDPDDAYERWRDERDAED